MTRHESASVDADERTAARSARLTTRIIKPGDDQGAIDRAYWESLSVSERLAFVWPLTRQQLEFAGYRGDQFRLRRSVTSIQRRGR